MVTKRASSEAVVGMAGAPSEIPDLVVTVVAVTSDDHVLLRQTQELELDCAVSTHVSASTENILGAAHELLLRALCDEAHGRTVNFRISDHGCVCASAGTPELVTVLERTKPNSFQFVFFAELKADARCVSALVERQRTRDNGACAAQEASTWDWVTVSSEQLYDMAVGRVEGKTGDTRLREELRRVVETFHPLGCALRKASKRSERAYPGGSFNASQYTRSELEDYALLDPLNYTYERPGKGVRSRCVRLLCEKYRLHPQDQEAMAFCIERMHEISLVVDDIEDGSALRREAECAYLRFGVPGTMNAAYLGVFDMIADVPRYFRANHDATQRLMIHGMVQAHRGQGWDIFWRDHAVCPTEEQYIAMIRGKTSTPFVMAVCLVSLHSQDWRVRVDRAMDRLAPDLLEWAEVVRGLVVLLLAWLVTLVNVLLVFCRIAPHELPLTSERRKPVTQGMFFEPSQLTMSLPSRRQRTVAHLFDLLGVFFQVRDDYINLTSATYWEKKGFCDDLFERKFSLPVIHMVRGRFGKYLELLRLYEQEQPLTRQDVEAMLSWIRETPALSFTRDVLQSLRMQIEEAITSAGFESLRERVLDSLPIDVP